jgi:alpha-glucuronidase
MDWRDLKLDRAKAAFDNFRPLDGAFEDNVIVQIKHGPIDFQVREPASPLFAALEKTSQVIELQITARVHRPAKAPLLPRADVERRCLDFDMQANGCRYAGQGPGSR